MSTFFSVVGSAKGAESEQWKEIYLIKSTLL